MRPMAVEQTILRHDRFIDACRRNSRLQHWGPLAVLLLATIVGCTSSPFRYVESASDLREWNRDLESYPHIDRKTDHIFDPVDPESVEVYFANHEKKPQRSYLRLARIQILRRPLPDHTGALDELRARAAALGAAVLTDVGYTVVVGERHIGGSRLLGWVYHGDARSSTMRATRRGSRQ